MSYADGVGNSSTAPDKEDTLHRYESSSLILYPLGYGEAPDM